MLLAGEVAVVPQQRKSADNSAAALLRLADQGNAGGAKDEVALGNHVALHHDQLPLDQLQLALGHSVEHREGVVGAAVEARTLGVAEGAVVVEPGLLPAVGSAGPLPTQEMHAAAPFRLLEALFCGDALQARGF